MYSQPHLIGTWLIGSSGSDQDFTPDNHCYDRQVASLSVITMAYQVRNRDHFLNSRLTRFRLSGVDCISEHLKSKHLHTGFLNKKWQCHVLLLTSNSSYSKTY